jgi:hypothetical protein
MGDDLWTLEAKSGDRFEAWTVRAQGPLVTILRAMSRLKVRPDVHGVRITWHR